MKKSLTVISKLIVFLFLFATYRICAGCNTDDYVCNDGACVSRDRVCDSYSDCEDGSDETDCGSVPSNRILLPVIGGSCLFLVIVLRLLYAFCCKDNLRDCLFLQTNIPTGSTTDPTSSPMIPLETPNDDETRMRSSDNPPSYEVASTYPTYTGKDNPESSAVQAGTSTIVSDTRLNLPPPTYHQALVMETSINN